ncbi:hypothetical protein H1R20_g10689, partial [Candolleomyces eurysporus]
MNRLVDNCKAFMVAAVESFERRVLTGEIDIGQGFKAGTQRLAANTFWNLVVAHNQDNDPNSDFARVTKWLPESKREQFNTLDDDVKAACKVAASEVNQHTALQTKLLTGSGRSTKFLPEQGTQSQSGDDSGCSTRFFMLDHPQGVTVYDPQQHASNQPQDPPPPVMPSFSTHTWDSTSSIRSSRRKSSSSGGPERAKRSKKMNKDTRDRYMELGGRPAQHPRTRKAPHPAHNGASTPNDVGSFPVPGDLELAAANSFMGGSLSTQVDPCSVSRLGSTVDYWSNNTPNPAQGSQGGLISFYLLPHFFSEQQLKWCGNLQTVGFDLPGDDSNHLITSSDADVFSVSDAATPSSSTTETLPDFFSQAASPATTDWSCHSEYYSTPLLQSLDLELPDPTNSFPTPGSLGILPTTPIGLPPLQSSSAVQFDHQPVFAWDAQDPSGAASTSAPIIDNRPSNPWLQGGNQRGILNRTDQFPASLAPELYQGMSNSVSAYQPFASTVNGIAATGEGQVQAACHNPPGLSGAAHLTSNSDFFNTGPGGRLKEAPATTLRQSIGAANSGPTPSTVSALDGALGNSMASGGHFNDVFPVPLGNSPTRNLHGGGFGSLQALDPSLGVHYGVGTFGSQSTPGSNDAVGYAPTTGYDFGDFAAQIQTGSASSYYQPVVTGDRGSLSTGHQYAANGPGVDLDGGWLPRSFVQRHEFL